MAKGKSVLPIVLLVGAGLGAVALVSKGTEAPKEEGGPPKSVVDRVVRAISTTDPGVMRALATQLDGEGWRVQADALRKAADTAAALKAASVISGDLGKASSASGSQARAPKSRRAPAEPIPGSPIPGVIAPDVSPPSHEDPLRDRAVAMIEELLRSRPGQEDRSVVEAYQRAHPSLKPSGHYGPGTALTLLRWQLVPPRPRVWPRTGRVRSKDRYRKLLLFWAQRDPQRADEWTRAALV